MLIKHVAVLSEEYLQHAVQRDAWNTSKVPMSSKAYVEPRAVCCHRPTAKPSHRPYGSGNVRLAASLRACGICGDDDLRTDCGRFRLGQMVVDFFLGPASEDPLCLGI